MSKFCQTVFSWSLFIFYHVEHSDFPHFNGGGKSLLLIAERFNRTFEIFISLSLFLKYDIFNLMFINSFPNY